jgi:hypothetical protein
MDILPNDIITSICEFLILESSTRLIHDHRFYQSYHLSVKPPEAKWIIRLMKTCKYLFKVISHSLIWKKICDILLRDQSKINLDLNLDYCKFKLITSIKNTLNYCMEYYYYIMINWFKNLQYCKIDIFFDQEKLMHFEELAKKYIEVSFCNIQYVKVIFKLKSFKKLKENYHGENVYIYIRRDDADVIFMIPDIQTLNLSEMYNHDVCVTYIQYKNCVYSKINLDVIEQNMLQYYISNTNTWEITEIKSISERCKWSNSFRDAFKKIIICKN